jgi:hypothetical protein
MKKNSIELLKDAYAIIGGIPSNRFDLRAFQQVRSGGGVAKRAKEIHCGTLACAGGWLALHPQFNRLGLRADREGRPTRKGDDYPFSALATTFGLTLGDTQRLFGARAASILIPANFARMSDKQLWLKRCRDLIAKLEEEEHEKAS